MPHASSHERPAGPWATLILMKPRYGPSQSAGSYGAFWILRSHRSRCLGDLCDRGDLYNQHTGFAR